MKNTVLCIALLVSLVTACTMQPVPRVGPSGFDAQATTSQNSYSWPPQSVWGDWRPGEVVVDSIFVGENEPGGALLPWHLSVAGNVLWGAGATGVFAKDITDPYNIKPLGQASGRQGMTAAGAVVPGGDKDVYHLVCSAHHSDPSVALCDGQQRGTTVWTIPFRLLYQDNRGGQNTGAYVTQIGGRLKGYSAVVGSHIQIYDLTMAKTLNQWQEADGDREVLIGTLPYAVGIDASISGLDHWLVVPHIVSNVFRLAIVDLRTNQTVFNQPRTELGEITASGAALYRIDGSLRLAQMVNLRAVGPSFAVNTELRLYDISALDRGQELSALPAPFARIDVSDKAHNGARPDFLTLSIVDDIPWLFVGTRYSKGICVSARERLVNLVTNNIVAPPDGFFSHYYVACGGIPNSTAASGVVLKGNNGNVLVTANSAFMHTFIMPSDGGTTPPDPEPEPPDVPPGECVECPPGRKGDPGKQGDPGEPGKQGDPGKDCVECSVSTPTDCRVAEERIPLGCDSYTVEVSLIAGTLPSKPIAALRPLEVYFTPTTGGRMRIPTPSLHDNGINDPRMQMLEASSQKLRVSGVLPGSAVSIRVEVDIDSVLVSVNGTTLEAFPDDLSPVGGGEVLALVSDWSCEQASITHTCTN